MMVLNKQMVVLYTSIILWAQKVKILELLSPLRPQLSGIDRNKKCSNESSNELSFLFKINLMLNHIAVKPNLFMV